jgi:hypothetical protein
MERKNWGVVEEDFVVLDLKAPTPSEEQKLQLNDQSLNCIYEALDSKVFKSIKDLEMAQGLEEVRRSM